MSGEPRKADSTLFKRVQVIVRSWDGPNSRLGVELDLSQMPWGPFDALGKRLSLLVPAGTAGGESLEERESQLELALRHVEHAADRCAEFARLSDGNQDLWLRSQRTWEWIRKYLTSLWVEEEVEGGKAQRLVSSRPELFRSEADASALPPLPGAASTLRVAARALREIPLSVWREAVQDRDPDAPTREEAVQTLLGVARILTASGERRGEEESRASRWGGAADPNSGEGEGRDAEADSSSHLTEAGGDRPAPAPPAADPDQVSFDFARGYDEGYRMGRKVGLALASHRTQR